LDLRDLHPTEFAQQLALIEFEIFKSIQPREYSHQNWCREGKERLAPNILRLINQFNALSNWAASEILLIENAKQRAAALHRLIVAAEVNLELLSKFYILELFSNGYYFFQESRAIKNYNSMMAIVSGLQSTPVYRLKRTWDVSKFIISNYLVFKVPNYLLIFFLF
jgi:hypothetical protein